MTPNPISPYAVAKLASEHYMISFYRCYGLETVCLRYFNIFGPRQDPSSPYSGVLAKFSMQMLRGDQPTIFGDGEISRDFTYIDNAVSANLLACSAPAADCAGRVFNCATGQRTTLNQTFEALKGLTGYTGTVKYAPERGGDIKHSLADISRAEKHLGYKVLVSFENGLRLKVKGDEYRRIHALISGLSPLSVWQAMQAGDDMIAIRRDLPEEFWDDFDSIQRLLAAQVSAFVERAEAAAATVATLTDKEVGLRLTSFDEDIRGLLFDLRKTGAGWTTGRARQKLFRLIRPEANVLPGYTPSSILIRAVEEAQD